MKNIRYISFNNMTKRYISKYYMYGIYLLPNVIDTFKTK